MTGGGRRREHGDDGRLERVEVAAPAKLNLALLVGPVRPDGFHEIASLMLPVTLADHVTVERTPGAGLDVVCDVAPGADNLAAKLVRELEARLDRTFEVRVTIDKRVPPGRRSRRRQLRRRRHARWRSSGCSRSISRSRLRYEVAAAIGSDVPFFLWPGPQLAMGRGQVLKPVELPALHLVVAIPDLGLSTAAVYRWRDEDAEVTHQGVRAAGARCSRARRRPRRRRPTWRRWSPTTSSRAWSRARRRSASCSSACARRGARGCDDGQRRRRVRHLRRRGGGAGGAGGAGPARAWYVTDLQPAAPAARLRRGRARLRACVIEYPAASRRAAGRLAALRPSVAGA